MKRDADNGQTKSPNPKSQPKPKKPQPLGKNSSSEANRRAAIVLEVLAGIRTPGQAAEALKLSVNYYYVLERKALQGLLAACRPSPKGPPGPSLERQLQQLQLQLAQCRNECQRQAALVRATQRAVGLPAPAAPKPQPSKKSDAKTTRKRRRRRPSVRALRAAAKLRQNSAAELRENSSLENSLVEVEQDASTSPQPSSRKQETQGGTHGQEAAGCSAR